MPEYIDRQAAKDAIKREWDGCGGLHEAWAIIKDTCDAIDEVPPADVRPAVRGRWEIRAVGIDGEDVYCSTCECGGAMPYWPFCPMCGADMREGEKKA